MTAPNIGDRVRLKSDEAGRLLTVVSIFVEGNDLWASLELAKGGLRIHRAVAELRAEGGA